MTTPLPIDESHEIPADELQWTAVRSSGPGGQNVNKVASKVELRFDVTATRILPEDAKARLATLAGFRMDSSGVLHVVAQDTRDQRKNLALARERLAELVRACLVRPKRRRATRPSRGAKERRLKDKRQRSDTKQSRSRPSGD